MNSRIRIFRESKESRLLVVVGVVFLTTWAISQFHQTTELVNFLFPGPDLRGLSTHLIQDERKHPHARKIALLGNSAVSSSDVPQSTTPSDYLNRLLPVEARSFNLGLWSGTLLTSFIVYRRIAEFEPTDVVICLTPEDLMREKRLNALVIENLAWLLPALPQAVREEVERNRRGFSDTLNVIAQRIRPFARGIANRSLQSWIYRLKERWYGPTFGAQGPYDIDPRQFEGGAGDVVSWPLLRILPIWAEQARQRNQRVWVYLPPVYDTDRAYGRDFFESFRGQVRQVTRLSGIRLVDFSDLLAPTHEYFLDHVHLTPSGNARLADAMLRELHGS